MPAGRRKRHPSEKFQTQAWYFSVQFFSGLHSPTELERHFQPAHFENRFGEKIASSRNWDKYANGSRTPRSHEGYKGVKGLVQIVGEDYPETEELFASPLWEALKIKQPNFSTVCLFLDKVDATVSQFYKEQFSFDSEVGEFGQSYSIGLFLRNLCDNPEIELCDYLAAMDHLAINLLAIRATDLNLQEHGLYAITKNLTQALNRLVRYPFIEPLYEEFFDWMQSNIWGNQFKFLTQDGEVISKWRESQKFW